MTLKEKRAANTEACRRYRAKNPKLRRKLNTAYARKWRKANLDKYQVYRRRYYERNKAKYLAWRRAYVKRHSERINAMQREWRRKNPAKAQLRDLRHRLKQDYGITMDAFNAMMKAQKGRCAICRKLPPNGRKKGQWRRLCIDHCHNSLRVRGLLCQQCNVGIAMFQDNPALMLRAIDYIRR